MTAFADSSAQTLPFTQNWTNTGLITANDNWSGVPGVEGFLGQDITTATGTDPQTLLGTSSVASDLDVIANQTNPNTLATGGVAEFDGIANPSIALNGSGTADAPYILIHLNTTGQQNINVAYNLRDLDGSIDNAIQPVALQYRVGSSGNFTNLPAGFVADATTGPSLQIVYARNNADFPESYRSDATRPARISDHDIPVVYFNSNCSFTVSPLVRNFSAKIGSGTFKITTEAGCAWDALESIPWVAFTSATSGIGNGSVSFDVEANPGTARSGGATIAGHSVSIRQGTNFLDVAQNDIFYEYIGKISAAGITLGCSPDGTLFCPASAVTREQAAAFIIRALGHFNPVVPAQQDFADVPPSNPFYAFIGDMCARGITLGCDPNSPVRLYCPSSNLRRDQTAAFIIRALGEFSPPVPASQRFVDVPPSHIFYAFVEEMAVRGITLGCDLNGPRYCPAAAVTRGQLAAFLARAFLL